jgi:glycosyltransferase involved in cell wall biosynthesis
MNKKPGILIIGNYPPPYGGVPRLLEYVVPHLVQAGWSVQVVSGGETGIESHDGFAIYRPSRQDLWFDFFIAALTFPVCIWRYGYFGTFGWRNYLRQLAMNRYLSRRLVTHNIRVVCAYNLLHKGFLAYLFGQQHRIPIVIYNFGEIYSEKDRFLHDKDLKRFTDLVLRKAARLVSCSRHCADSYKMLGYNPKVEVVNTCVDLSKFHPTLDRAIIRQKFSIRMDQKVVTFVGRMTEELGLQTILEIIPSICRQRTDVVFIIGGVRAELTNEVLEVASRNPDLVHIAVDISFDDLPYYYAASDVVLAPSLNNRACSTLAAIEAMAVAVPVIATRVGGIPEAVLDGKTGVLIEPNDRIAMLQAITRLITDESLRRRLGQAGRERVEDLFDKDKMNEKTEQIFRDAAGLTLEKDNSSVLHMSSRNSLQPTKSHEMLT